MVHIHLTLQAAITVPGGGSRGYPYSARLTYTRITYHSSATKQAELYSELQSKFLRCRLGQLHFTAGQASLSLHLQ